MRKIYFALSFLLLGFIGNSQIISIPNQYFKTKLTVQSTVYGYAKDINGQSMIVDVNNNGEIEVIEAQQVYALYVGGSGIDDLTGIEYFINVRTLWCNSGELTTLNVSTLTHLQTLLCNNNDLVSLNINGLSELTTLRCQSNNLTSLDVSGCNSLFIFWCFDNQLQSIDITSLANLNDFRCTQNNLTSLNAGNKPSLSHLECDSNQLTSLNVSGSINLNHLSCNNNQLSTMNVLGLTQLDQLWFGYNPISSIDLTGLSMLRSINMSATNIPAMNFEPFPLLQYLTCVECSLTTIDVSSNTAIFAELNCSNSPVVESVFMKNGRLNGLAYFGSPLLSYICADENEIEYIGNPPNITINSYCSFTPGGVFYTINGTAKYDGDNNGCNEVDMDFPNLKFAVTDGTINGTVIANNTGSYSIPVQAGAHTLSPILENPSYFTIFPATTTISFPTQPSPSTQNFCISPNGTHNDLEITVMPVNLAIPGFDSQYKISYKNKGTATQSGTIGFDFNDAVLDLLSANPAVTNQSPNHLSFDFTNLQPFETKEISLVLNLNSPTEIPPLNESEILNYTVTITGATDEIPSDNIFILNQTVINSFDPNDKTCLEGAIITPAKVGDYVHYMIRFENTGTANAQNIVVKDMIDTSKFDVSTLIPLDASHSFITRITNTNQVEFIFENIQLPFDDANNDGYVVFKIKTKPTLVLGDTFSNTASIYFDYNFPIVTNTYATTVAALANQDFEFANYFSLYPNPANQILNIKTKDSIEVSSISIYNVLGQLMIVISNAKETDSIDVSSLTTGNYFIKIVSDKGTSNAKFIKA